MPYDKKICIASNARVHARVDELKHRSEDVKSRVAMTLKDLWNPERLLKGVDEKIDFDSLKKGFPQFCEVIDYVNDAVFTSHLSKAHFTLPPILLQGDPGLGKTYFGHALASILGLPFHEISMATTTASFALSGGSLQWGEGTVGKVSQILGKSSVANPMVLIDEVDKCSGSDHYTVTNVLYSLLEPHTARRFTDEALEIELDASHVIWILTANDPDRIPRPILSRMRVFSIEQPGIEAMMDVVEVMYAKFRSELPFGHLLTPELNFPVLQKLSTQSPRAIRLGLQEAAMKAVRRGKNAIDVDDLTNLSRKENHRVGFI